VERVAIVTDSTADLPLSYYQENDVTMVPLTTRFGEETFLDWVELSPPDFFMRLRGSAELPKTSQPSVAQFAETYQKLAVDHDHIISLHLSAKLSGTVESASTARETVKNIPISIIDTKLVSVGIGLVIDVLVRARSAGNSAPALVEMAEQLMPRIKCVGALQTLKYLELGGRIGKAQSMLGSLLDIKPLLTIEDGIIAPYKRARGTKKAFQELVGSIQEETSGQRSLRIAIAHADNVENLNYVKGLIQEAGIKHHPILESYVGSVIGTYAGPDAILALFYED
jgi:DegV family protein with EDD domain